MITREIPNGQITLDRHQVSDLFFNAEHPEFDAACACAVTEEAPLLNCEVAADQRRDALREDAQLFATLSVKI